MKIIDKLKGLCECEANGPFEGCTCDHMINDMEMETTYPSSKNTPLADRNAAQVNTSLRMNAALKKERIASRGY